MHNVILAPGACAPCCSVPSSHDDPHDDPHDDLYGPGPGTAVPRSEEPRAVPVVPQAPQGQVVVPQAPQVPQGQVYVPQQPQAPQGQVYVPQQPQAPQGQVVMPRQGAPAAVAPPPTAFAFGALDAALKSGRATMVAATAPLPAFAPPAEVVTINLPDRTRNPPLSSAAGLSPAGLVDREAFAALPIDRQAQLAWGSAPEAAEGIVGLLVLGDVDAAYNLIEAAAGPGGGEAGPADPGVVSPAGLVAGDANDEALGFLFALEGHPAGCLSPAPQPAAALLRAPGRVEPAGAVVSIMRAGDARALLAAAAADLAEERRLIGHVNDDAGDFFNGRAFDRRRHGRLAEALTGWQWARGGAADALAAEVAALRSEVGQGALPPATAARVRAVRDGAARELASYREGALAAAEMLAALRRGGAHAGHAEAAAARLVSAVAPAGEVTTPAQQQAARDLIAYVQATATLRSNVYDARVAQYQRAMGGVTADGKYGPTTQGRVRSVLGSGTIVPEARGDAGAAAGGSGAGTGTAAQQQAARDLAAYVRATPSLRGNVRDARVEQYQRAMGGVTADGKYGSGTMTRMRALLGASASIPAAPTGGSPAATPAPTSAPAPGPAAAQRQAAEELAAYVRATPSLRGNIYDATVSRLQRAIGSVTVDGKYGSNTMTRMRALGVDPPAAPAGGGSPAATAAPGQPAATEAPGGARESTGSQIAQVMQSTAAIIAALNPQARASTEADTRLQELRDELARLTARGESAERDAQLQRALDQVQALQAQLTQVAMDAANRQPNATPPPMVVDNNGVSPGLIMGGVAILVGVVAAVGVAVAVASRGPSVAGFQGGPVRLGPGPQGQYGGQVGYAA